MAAFLLFPSFGWLGLGLARSKRSVLRTVSAVGIVGLLLLSGCSPSTDPRLPPAAGEFRIPEFQPGKCKFDYQAAVSFVTRNGVVEWSRDVPWTGFGDSPPLIVDDLIVVATESGVAALNLKGEAVWQADGDDTIAATADSLFVFGYDGLKRLAPSSGETKWEWSGTGLFGLGGPLPVGDSAVFINDAGTIRAIDQDSGQEVWDVQTVGDHSHPPVLAQDGNIYHAAFEGVLYAISPDNGVVLWEWRARPGVAITDQIEAENGVVTLLTRSLSGDPFSSEAPSDAEQFIALDASTGSELWRTPVRSQTGEVVERWSSLVVIRQGRTLEARRLSDGELQWTTDRTQVRNNSIDPIAATEDSFVIFGGRKSRVVTAYDISTGAELWSTVLGEFEHSIGVVFGDLLIVGSTTELSSAVVDQVDAGPVHALDIDTGNVVWEHTFRDSASDTVAEIEAGFIIATQDPPIFCD